MRYPVHSMCNTMVNARLSSRCTRITSRHNSLNTKIKLISKFFFQSKFMNSPIRYHLPDFSFSRAKGPPLSPKMIIINNKVPSSTRTFNSSYLGMSPYHLEKQKRISINTNVSIKLMVKASLTSTITSTQHFRIYDNIDAIGTMPSFTDPRKLLL